MHIQTDNQPVTQITEWSHFGQVTDDIDPHLYEVAHVMDGNR